MARNFDVSIVLGFVDKASKELNDSLQKNKEQFKKVGLAATAMGTAITAASFVAIRAAAKQQEQEILLAEAMKVAGTFTQEAFEHNLEYAASLQKMSTFGDEAIFTVQKMLTNFGVEGKMLDSLTKATLDLATAKGMDLRAAADLVSKSVGSSTNALSRYGITITGAVGSTERMQMAVDNISKLFGGAALAGTKTFNGMLTQLWNRIGDMTEKIGFALIPILEKFVKILGDKILPPLEKFLDNNKALIGVIVPLISGFGALMVAMGPLLIFLPNIVTTITTMLIPAIKGLFAIIAAHPLTALAVGLVAVTTSALALADAYIEDRNAAINVGKTIKDRIKLLEKEKEKTIELLQNNKLSAEEREKLENRTLSTIRAIRMLEVKLEKQTNEELLAAQQERADIANEARLADYEQRKTDHNAYIAWLQEIDNLVNENIIAQNKIASKTISGGWKLAMQDMIDNAMNWRQRFTQLTNEVISSTQAGFAHMMTNIGQGWKSFADGFQKIAEGIRNAFINMLAKVVAEWVTQHIIMKGITLAWKAIEVAAAAAIGAARAAAAMAWTLWGAIAFGAAIGLAIMAFKDQFADGVRNFSGGMALVGEQGPELVNLPVGSSVFSNPETRAILAGGGGINIIVNVTGNQILDEFGAEGLADTVSDVILDRLKNERNI